MVWFCVTAQIEEINERKTQSLASKCQFLEKNKACILHINLLMAKAMNAQHLNISKAYLDFGIGMYAQLHAAWNSIYHTR